MVKCLAKLHQSRDAYAVVHSMRAAMEPSLRLQRFMPMCTEGTPGLHPRCWFNMVMVLSLLCTGVCSNFLVRSIRSSYPGR